MSKPICFVAMPAGRQEPERLICHAWYRLVFEPAVREAGFEPYLQLAQIAPIHISSEIRRQLIDAPMALFDLGGVTVDDSPNANVMYELGIRHAFWA